MIIDAAINIHKKAIQDHYRSYKTLGDTRPQIEQVSLANMFCFLFLLHYLFALEQFFCKYFWVVFFCHRIFFFRFGTLVCSLFDAKKKKNNNKASFRTFEHELTVKKTDQKGPITTKYVLTVEASR